MEILVRKRLRVLITFIIWGFVIGGALGMLLGWMDELPLARSCARGIAVGIIIGSGVGAYEEFLLPRWSRLLGFGWLTVARISAHAVTILIALNLVNGADRALALGTGFFEALAEYAREGGMARDLGFALVAAVVATSFLEVRKLHNPGEIRRLLTGRYHYPEEENRVFLFADLADSTGTAERLGDLAFSGFLRSCFSDVSEAILAWRGEVYQHAGDSVIVSWPMEEGIRDGACLRCFFDMVGLLEARLDSYRSRYGVEPYLRAGVHCGHVVTTWVGEARKELAFHGDTMNTTARMEALCKDFGVQCLTSAVVRDAVHLPAGLQATPVGEVELRGRSVPVQLFSVSRL